MTNIVKRFTHLDKSTKINLLIYPFFMATLSYGLGFVVFGWASGVHHSSLFAAMTSLHPWIPFIWGTFALLTVITALILIATRASIGIGDTAALLGTMVWIFAGIVYAATGGWLLVFAVTLPNFLFWLWYFFRLSRFRRYGIPDVDVDSLIR